MSIAFVRALHGARSSTAPLLSLLGPVSVTSGSTVAWMTNGEARLLAYLAVHPGPTERRHAAETLWPDVEEARAFASLRSVLWRLHHHHGGALVTVGRGGVELSADVLVDTQVLSAWAARIIARSPHPDDLEHIPWELGPLELLPGWHEDWLELERARFRQRLLHALEVLSGLLVAAGRYAEAVEVALIAVDADRLRESARRALMTAYLAEGNRAEATRCFADHRAHLARELGVGPSPALAALLTVDG